MKPNRPRANAFHFWSSKDDVFTTKKPETTKIIEVEEGTPTPKSSPTSSITSKLVKQTQSLVYDSDDEFCTSTPKKNSAFFPNIGVRVNTPVYDHESSELRMVRPQLFRQKGVREELSKQAEDHGYLDLTPKKTVRFREAYPEKFKELISEDLDVPKINKEALERTPRPKSPVPFLSLQEFIKDLKDESPKKK